jgi:hypothetical protein
MVGLCTEYSKPDPCPGISHVLFIILLYTHSVPLHKSATEHTSKANCLLSADGSYHKLQVITHSDSVNERVK